MDTVNDLLLVPEQGLGTQATIERPDGSGVNDPRPEENAALKRL